MRGKGERGKRLGTKTADWLCWVAGAIDWTVPATYNLSTEGERIKLTVRDVYNVDMQPRSVISEKQIFSYRVTSRNITSYFIKLLGNN